MSWQGRDHARSIWMAAVEAVRPRELLRAVWHKGSTPLVADLDGPGRILVVGAGKAGSAMSASLEELLGEYVNRVAGIVNVPAESVRPLRAIRLHAARSMGSNQPTPEGVDGTEQILRLLQAARPDDIAICLLSGGGSALLPAPVATITLADKQEVTRLLHACGATINEMNAVRKHLSRVKGGRLAQTFRGRALYSLIISDVVGDPVDVISSGPTAVDPTTFADALAVVNRYRLSARVPPEALHYLQEGARGNHPETLKTLPANIHNLLIGNNAGALCAAEKMAVALGYAVLNLGSFLEGETQEVAHVLASIVRSLIVDAKPLAPPVCILSGGETIVTLDSSSGRGGRNQEFTLALADRLGEAHLRGVVVLSGGTDGEDGPTDAAGAIADEGTFERARFLALSPREALERHDAYPFFASTGDLLKTGLTETNVMDVRVILVNNRATYL